MKRIMMPLLAVALFATAGCTTQTRRFAAGETRQTVAGFSEEEDTAQQVGFPLTICVGILGLRESD